jgi:hypothetical protein
MTHAALAPLIGPEFDEFLGASIGKIEMERASASFRRLHGSTLTPGKKPRASGECRGKRLPDG